MGLYVSKENSYRFCLPFTDRLDQPVLANHGDGRPGIRAYRCDVNLFSTVNNRAYGPTCQEKPSLPRAYKLLEQAGKAKAGRSASRRPQKALQRPSTEHGHGKSFQRYRHHRRTSTGSGKARGVGRYLKIQTFESGQVCRTPPPASR
jgi:hypothetical protein